MISFVCVISAIDMAVVVIAQACHHVNIPLQLYSIYTSGFEDAIKLLTEWTKKEKRFDMLVKNFEVRSGFVEVKHGRASWG